MKLTRDGWAGLVALAASLFLFFQTLGLKDNPLVPVGPGFYPRIVLALTALLAAGVVAASLLRSRGGTGAQAASRHGAVLVQFGVFALYTLALPWLGFRMATFLYVAVANALLAPPAGPKGWLRVAALALAATAVIYVAFELYLHVLLPRGRWTGI